MVRSESQLKNGALDHLYKVHCVAGLGLATAMYGAHLHTTGEVNGGEHMTIAQLVLASLLAATSYGNGTDGVSFGRLILFIGFAFCAGTNVGTWVESALTEAGFCHTSESELLTRIYRELNLNCDVTHSFVNEALQVTAAIYAAFSISAFVMPTRTLVYVGAFSAIGIMCLWADYLLAQLGFSVFNSVLLLKHLKLGIVIFGAKTAWDTHMILEDYDMGRRDVLNHAVEALINFLNLFIRVIKLMAELSKKTRS